MIVNPFTQNSPINSIKLNSILDLGGALLDRGSLAKLHDCHPLNLFTIGNSIKLFFEADQEVFFFFIVLGFWNESLLNIKLAISTRQYFLEIILFVFIRFYTIIKTQKMQEIVSFKKCEGKHTLWVSEFKLIRVIITILTQLYTIYLKDDSVAFDRFCNQPTENFIGLIRMLCNGDDSYPTVIHNLSRYEYVNRSSKDLYIHHQPKRLNVGGCLLTDGEIELKFDHSSLALTDLLFSYMQGGDANMKLMEEFINSIQKINDEAPYRTRNVPNKSSGSKIMRRLISIANLNKCKSNKEWNNEEMQMINRILLTNSGFPDGICKQVKLYRTAIKKHYSNSKC